MNKIYLQLGSNIGERERFIDLSITKISDNIGEIINESRTYESSAWGITSQRNFLNKIIYLESLLNEKEILIKTQKIEKDIGRIKKGKWRKRIIDIDILFINHDIIKTKRLHVPHPLIQERLFVLIPLFEIAPNLIHPIYNKNIKTLLSECEDKSVVKEYEC